MYGQIAVWLRENRLVSYSLHFTSVWLPENRLVWLPENRLVWLPENRLVWLPDNRLVWLPDNRLVSQFVQLMSVWLHEFVATDLSKGALKL